MDSASLQEGLLPDSFRTITDNKKTWIRNLSQQGFESPENLNGSSWIPSLSRRGFSQWKDLGSSSNLKMLVRKISRRTQSCSSVRAVIIAPQPSPYFITSPGLSSIRRYGECSYIAYWFQSLAHPYFHTTTSATQSMKNASLPLPYYLESGWPKSATLSQWNSSLILWDRLEHLLLALWPWTIQPLFLYCPALLHRPEKSGEFYLTPILDGVLFLFA